MQLDKQFHVIDTESSRLLQGFGSFTEAEGFANAQATANPAKVLAIVEVLGYRCIETKVKAMAVTDFIESEEDVDG